MSGQVTLVAQGVATVVLPWWPSELARSGMTRSWTEIERPGRRPLLLSTGLILDEYAVGCTIRSGGHPRQDVNVPGMVDDLHKIGKAKAPVSLVMAGDVRGQFHLADLSIVELEHGVDGRPTAVDVSFTLKRASEATVKVGPIPRKRNKVPKKLKGVRGTGRQT